MARKELTKSRVIPFNHEEHPLLLKMIEHFKLTAIDSLDEFELEDLIRIEEKARGTFEWSPHKDYQRRMARLERRKALKK